MNDNFYRRLLFVIVWLTERIIPRGPIRIGFGQVRIDGNLLGGNIKVMELREGQKVTATVTPQTATGHAAAYQTGSAAWASSDPAVASVTPNPDNELEADIVGLDGSSNASVSVSCHLDGDPDADQTRDIVAEGVVTVTQGEATVAAISFGTPTDA